MKDAVFTCFGPEKTGLQSEEITASCVVLKYDPLTGKMLLPPNTDSYECRQLAEQHKLLYNIYYFPVHDHGKCVYLTFDYTASPLIL